MSNQNINISNQNVQGKCDLKCSYSYNYPESSNLTAQNQGVSIVLTPDNTSSPAVTYNNQKYNVSNFSIVCPSLHNYNGSQAAAEILITHAPVNGGQNLSVAIPIISSTDSSTASYLITEIIQSVATNAPSQGNSTNLNLSGFTLKVIIPKKPFYSYTDATTDWIVFGTLYGIPLNSNTLNRLKQIIKPYPLPMRGGSLFFNSSGPNSGLSIGDGIYIKCNPTGSSTEETAVEYSKNTPSYDLMNLLQSPVTMLILQIIIGCILFIIIFYVISYIFSFITTGSTKIPTSLIPGQTGGKKY